MTRPEPTIYGNCDSWNFIVGKKPWTYSPKNSKQGALQCNNEIFIHSLFTGWRGWALDNLWVICGSSVNKYSPSRMVEYGPLHMPAIARQPPGFYPILLLTIKQVSGHKQNSPPALGLSKKVWRRFLEHWPKEKPQILFRFGVGMRGCGWLSGRAVSTSKWPTLPFAAAPEPLWSGPVWPPPPQTP